MKNGLEALMRIVTSSNFSSEQIGLSAEGKRFLAQTVFTPTIEVYRGLYVMKSRVSQEGFTQLKSLQPEDAVPDFIAHNSKNDFTSATKKLAIAKRYARDGNINIVMRAIADETSIICDTTHLREIIGDESQDIVSESDFEYFKREQEVIVSRALRYFVVSVK
jgi:hypothetical protein